MSKPPFSLSRYLQAAAGDLLVSVFAIFLIVASFWAEDVIPYLFPQILASTMLFLCVLQLIHHARHPKDTQELSNFLCSLRDNYKAIIFIILYVALAETLGFYAAAFIGFIGVVFIGGIPPFSRRQIITISIAATGTCLVLYVLFTILLKVQVPHGIIY